MIDDDGITGGTADNYFAGIIAPRKTFVQLDVVRYTAAILDAAVRNKTCNGYGTVKVTSYNT
jgi:hypothetical protein